MGAEEERLLAALLEETTRRLRGSYAPVPIKEYYTIDEVSRLLEVHVQRIRDMARRDDDPLPRIVFPDSRKNAVIHQEDLREWLKRNCIPYAVARPRRGGR